MSDNHPDDAVAHRARLTRVPTRDRCFVSATALPAFERDGWERTGAVTPGPLGTELYEITRYEE